MMKFFRLYARLRYWRTKANYLEKKLAIERGRVLDVQAQAEAERYRNLEREDMFVSATVMGTRGMYGVPPRVGPAQVKQIPQLAQAADPWSALHFNEKAEFETEWMPAAEAYGKSRQQAQQDFLLELANRKSLNDERSM